jgi:CheY-like chemotaxis protein
MASGGFAASDSLRGRVVLVVDRDDNHRRLLGTVLRHCGAIVRDLASLDATWAALETLIPDALVLAVGVGQEQVVMFVRRVRSLPREKGGKVPVIGVGPASEAPGARMNGFDAFLDEPIDAWALCSVLAELMR